MEFNSKNALESFIATCDELLIPADEGLVDKLKGPDIKSFSKQLKAGNKNITENITFNGKSLTLKYKNTKQLESKYIDAIITCIGQITSILGGRQLGYCLIMLTYSDEEKKKFRDRLKLSKNIYVKEISFNGNGEKLKVDIILRDDNKGKDVNLSKIPGSKSDQVKKAVKGNPVMTAIMTNQMIDMQNQIIQQQIMLNNQMVQQQIQQQQIQQANQWAMNQAINASLNASAMSMGMPPGSFGAF